jgi:hypothetical protein
MKACRVPNPEGGGERMRVSLCLQFGAATHQVDRGRARAMQLYNPAVRVMCLDFLVQLYSAGSQLTLVTYGQGRGLRESLMGHFCTTHKQSVAEGRFLVCYYLE